MQSGCTEPSTEGLAEEPGAPILHLPVVGGRAEGKTRLTVKEKARALTYAPRSVGSALRKAYGEEAELPDGRVRARAALECHKRF